MFTSDSKALMFGLMADGNGPPGTVVFAAMLLQVDSLLLAIIRAGVRKVASLRVRRQHTLCEDSGARLVLRSVRVVEKEEELVLQNRTTDVSTEIIACERAASSPSL